MQKIKKLLSNNLSINLLFFSIPLISMLMIEFAMRGDLLSTIIWPLREPIQFLISLSLFYAIYIFLWGNINRMGVTALSYTIVCVLISAITGCKREILGMPIMPWDIMIGSNVAGLLEGMDFTQLKFLFNWVFILVLVIIIAVVAAIFILQKSKRLNELARYTSSILCCIIVAAIVLTLPKGKMEESPTAICERNGYIRGFIVNAKLWSDMNNNSLEASAANDFQYEFTTRKATADNIKPNVVFIMSEAFWDDTILPNVTYSEDPIPNFHALAKECISGEMVSPTYGGITCNVEFEIMTGFSLKYLPYQTTAYVTSVKKPIPALPSYFKSLGYKTIAVHTYSHTFFNRASVYPMLGIDRFVTQKDMPDAVIKGAYIADDTFADYIIAEYKKAKKPVFMYNISMQNHWPYTKENYYKDNEFVIKTAKKLDKESMLALQNYTQGIHDADKSLKKITDYFKTVKEPTVVVFLGDHLPALTEQLGVYKKLGFIDESISDDDLFKGSVGTNVHNEKMLVQNQKILKVPYLIWSNCKTGMEKGKTLSAQYLGVYAMSKMGLEIPPFYNFLLDYSSKVPINRHLLSVAENGIPYKDTPPMYDDYEYTYKRIQNNILFGDQSEEDLFFKK